MLHSVLARWTSDSFRLCGSSPAGPAPSPEEPEVLATTGARKFRHLATYFWNSGHSSGCLSPRLPSHLRTTSLHVMPPGLIQSLPILLAVLGVRADRSGISRRNRYDRFSWIVLPLLSLMLESGARQETSVSSCAGES